MIVISNQENFPTVISQPLASLFFFQNLFFFSSSVKTLRTLSISILNHDAPRVTFPDADSREKWQTGVVHRD